MGPGRGMEIKKNLQWSRTAGHSAGFRGRARNSEAVAFLRPESWRRLRLGEASESHAMNSSGCGGRAAHLVVAFPSHTARGQGSAWGAMSPGDYPQERRGPDLDAAFAF